jgi:3-deoxy-7-phosphoheptulonate synthase
MIVVCRKDVTEPEIEAIRERVEALGLRTHVSRGEQRVIIGCIGDEALLGEASLLSLPGVESVTPVMKPYKLAALEFVGEASRVRVGDGASAVVGGRDLAIIAGPCSVEGREMLRQTAHSIRAAGARMLRGGAVKPPPSPYA